MLSVLKISGWISSDQQHRELCRCCAGFRSGEAAGGVSPSSSSTPRGSGGGGEVLRGAKKEKAGEGEGEGWGTGGTATRTPAGFPGGLKAVRTEVSLTTPRGGDGPSWRGGCWLSRSRSLLGGGGVSSEVGEKNIGAFGTKQETSQKSQIFLPTEGEAGMSEAGEETRAGGNSAVPASGSGPALPAGITDPQGQDPNRKLIAAAEGPVIAVESF